MHGVRQQRCAVLFEGLHVECLKFDVSSGSEQLDLREVLGEQPAEVLDVAHRHRGADDEFTLVSDFPRAHGVVHSDATVLEVVERFGAWAAPLLPQEELGRYSVKAVCAIKREGNATKQVGRHIRDYFPGYDDGAGKPPTSRKSARALLRAAADPLVLKAERRSGAAREVVLLMLAEFGVDGVKEVKVWRDLTKVLAGADSLERVRHVVLRCILGEYGISTSEEAVASARRILSELGDLVVDGAKSCALPDSWSEDSAAEGQMQGVPSNCLRVVVGAMEVPIHLATIASVKGETHLATLVLESCHSSKYDLKSVLPYLCGDASAAAVTDEATRGQLMNVFVAASRPRKLLAFAMHTDRANANSRKKLADRGWQILDWTLPLGAMPGAVAA